jgi:hypothetical protein
VTAHLLILGMLPGHTPGCVRMCPCCTQHRSAPAAYQWRPCKQEKSGTQHKQDGARHSPSPSDVSVAAEQCMPQHALVLIALRTHQSGNVPDHYWPNVSSQGLAISHLLTHALWHVVLHHGNYIPMHVKASDGDRPRWPLNRLSSTRQLM